MSATIKTEITKFGKGKAIVDPNMKSHADDPYFVKKAIKAKALIDKYGLPKDLK